MRPGWDLSGQLVGRVLLGSDEQTSRGRWEGAGEG